MTTIDGRLDDGATEERLRRLVASSNPAEPMDLEAIRKRVASVKRGAVSDPTDREEERIEPSPEETRQLVEHGGKSAINCGFVGLKKWTSVFREWFKRIFTGIRRIKICKGN